MRNLIVNADDFGYSFGVNKGIMEAHNNGIVTSTSVMVDAIAAGEAAALAKFANLSVGLHLVLTDLEHIEAELNRQIALFGQIVGRKPDHIDTHKSRPSARQEVKAILERYASETKTPVRSLGYAKFIESFFGINIDGSGILNEQNISVDALKLAIDEATDDYNELMCHPGYADDYLLKNSSYNRVREKELKTLTNPAIKEHLKQAGIMLCTWKDVQID